MSRKPADVPVADTEKSKGKLVGAVSNAATILRFLRSAQGPTTVTQITRGTAINPSTCFNILRTLIQEDWVQFDTTAKTYELSLGLVALARGALEQNPVLQLLQPKIEALARKHDIMVTVWRRISDDRTMLAAVAESDAAVRIYARVGTRSPLLLGASGRVFTAYSNLDVATLRKRYQQLRMARPLDFETYLQQLEQVRRTGWALDEGHVYAGTLTIAAPVLEPAGPPTLACSAILFNGQYDLQRVTLIAEELKQIGRALLDTRPTTEAPPVQRGRPPATKAAAKKTAAQPTGPAGRKARTK